MLPINTSPTLITTNTAFDSGISAFCTDSTTGFVAVTLPVGMACSNCLITVNSGVAATDLINDNKPFLFSPYANGSCATKVSESIVVGTGKRSGILGYVYTGTAALKITALVTA